MNKDRFGRDTMIRRGRQGEMEALIDFADFAFSRPDPPPDFSRLLPKLYGSDAETAEQHLLVVPESGDDILAAVYSGPLALQPSESWWKQRVHEGEPVTGSAPALSGNGIGTVSVHHRERGKSYMRELMHAAIRDMLQEGAAFSALSGQRQRYAYYGYEPAGTDLSVSLDRDNYTKAYGRHYFEEGPEGELRNYAEIQDEPELAEQVFAVYEASHPWSSRTRDNWYVTAGSWGGPEVLVYLKEGQVQGYLIAGGSGGHRAVSEIGLKDPEDAIPMIGLLLGRHQVQRAEVQLACWQPDPAARLFRIAAGYSIGSSLSLLILDWAQMLKAGLMLKQALDGARDGELRLAITDCPVGDKEQRLHIRVSKGKVRVDAIDLEDTKEAAAADAEIISIPYSLAVRMLWSPMSQVLLHELTPENRRKLNRTGWFPLPFSILPADRV